MINAKTVIGPCGKCAMLKPQQVAKRCFRTDLHPNRSRFKVWANFSPKDGVAAQIRVGKGASRTMEIVTFAMVLKRMGTQLRHAERQQRRKRRTTLHSRTMDGAPQ